MIGLSLTCSPVYNVAITKAKYTVVNAIIYIYYYKYQLN